jgi:hypothetical protein
MVNLLSETLSNVTPKGRPRERSRRPSKDEHPVMMVVDYCGIGIPAHDLPRLCEPVRPVSDHQSLVPTASKGRASAWRVNQTARRPSMVANIDTAQCSVEEGTTRHRAPRQSAH